MLEGVKTNQADQFIKFLREIDVGIREKLSADQTILNRQRLNRLLADVTELQKQALDKFTGQLVLDLDQIAVEDGKLEYSALSKSAPAAEFVLPAAKQMLEAYKQNPLSLRGKGQGLTLEPFLKSYTEDQIALINGKIAQGFAEGQTNSQIIQALRGTKANNYADGVLAVVDRNTKAMVRTAVQNASSAARQEIWNENTDLIVGVQWVSTLDSRTTEQCQALDGQIFPVDEGIRPPIHYNCRSTTAPVLADDVKFLQQGGKRPAKGENADGKLEIEQVSNKTTYYEWLKTQPDQFQDSVLGVDRADLFRNGGLSSERFRELQLNSNFKPRTLAEMAAEAPEAFKQANLNSYLQK